MSTFHDRTIGNGHSQAGGWTRWLLGRPLATADAPHQTIGKAIGLAVFSSDALSSVAYAPQELMFVLAAAGLAATAYAFPLAIGIVILLAILTISYEQTIHAYPGGGGAYIVARDNLGELPAQTAGAALLTDYILTVAVSISSGVAQIVSAYPSLYDYRVLIAIAMVAMITFINLRGVKESGATFAVPTYFFLGMMALTVVVGFVRHLSGSLGVVDNPPALELHALQPVTFFLILKAFASGTTALTGVEAISNGITAFKEPRSRNAGATLVIMAFILGTFMLGITYLSLHIQAVPGEAETVISQLGRVVFNERSLLYLGLISATTVILVMAANTAYADFPRLGALLAADGFLPRQLTYRGSRLVFSYGIISLGAISSLLIILFQASVSRLIPLYAIGVFLSFTLSQTGMSRRWWKSGRLKPDEEVHEPGSVLRYDRKWATKMVVNGFGGIVTFVVMIVFAVTKFHDGGWIVVVITPALVSIFFAIHLHYKRVARQLSLDNADLPGRLKKQRVIMPISGVHRGTLAALRYTRTLSDDITVVHVSIDPAETEKVKAKWDMWGDGYRLVILESPYRLFIEPLLEYIQKIEAIRKTNETITIVVPQFIAENGLSSLLHMRTADTLRKILLKHKDVVIIEVPYKIRN